MSFDTEYTKLLERFKDFYEAQANNFAKMGTAYKLLEGTDNADSLAVAGASMIGLCEEGARLFDHMALMAKKIETINRLNSGELNDLMYQKTLPL